MRGKIISADLETGSGSKYNFLSNYNGRFFTFFKSTDDVSVNLGHACAFDEIIDFA